jgi:hypothetical protein
LKPIDNTIGRMVANYQAVMEVNAYVASKVLDPEAEPATVGRRQHGSSKPDCAAMSHSGGVEATAWQ